LTFGAFFDDNGTHGPAKVRVFAGYVGTKDEWEAFGAKWLTLLSDAGVPYFRAFDCVRGEKTFAGVPEAQRLEYYARAIGIITERSILGTAVIGKHQDPQGGWLSRAGSDAEWHHSTYRDVVKFGLTRMVEDFEQRWPGELASVIIEQGTDMDMRLAVDAYLELKDSWPPYLRVFEGSPVFRSKTDHLELQAADVFAYEVGREDYRRYYQQDEAPREEWALLQQHAVRNGGSLNAQVHVKHLHIRLKGPD
jgi:hypothetical protein